MICMAILLACLLEFRQLYINLSGYLRKKKFASITVIVQLWYLQNEKKGLHVFDSMMLGRS